MTINIREDIWVSGILIDLDIYWWKGFLRLEPDDLDKTELEIPEVFRLGEKRILKQSVFSPFSRIESDARRNLILNSYKFITDKIRFVPYTRLETVIKNLTNLQEEFDLQTKLFIANYRINKIDFLNQYPDIANKIHDKYPDERTVEYRFSFSWKFIEMTMPRDVSSNIINSTQSEILKEQWERSQSSINDQLDDWTKQVAIDIKQEIISVCNKLKTIINNGKLIRPTTLERTRETIERIKDLNFLGDTEVDRQLENLKSELPRAEDREVPAIMSAFGSVLNNMVDELKSDITSSGELKRSFKL